VTPCWVCESEATIVWKRADVARPLRPDDLMITDARYGATLPLRRCCRCGFVFAEGAPDELLTLYRLLADPEYVATADTRALQMKWLLDHVFERRLPPATLLDVGAGTGLLVAEARRRGIDAVGLEPSRPMVAHARAAGLPVIEGTLSDRLLTDRTFDAVTLIDVIEHVTAPVPLLRDAAARLAVGGILILVTPNVASVPARLMGKRWWHFRLAHIGYFSPSSLAHAAQRAGLHVDETFTARWFFRIRYLAERIPRYAPIGAVTAGADRLGFFRRLYERTVSFDLHDSIGLVMRRERNADAVATTKGG
jgi:2-polyprenyl-3-methyl-5-hydroxy-6-metoxy-1,4-benzoquinol methylase